jgi:putative RNA 2'-phosphotransferase
MELHLTEGRNTGFTKKCRRCVGCMSEKEISKFISLILRHKPETIGISLDEHGWADVDELIDGVSKTHPLDMPLLEKIVAENDKQRYSFNEDKTLIRANQGHSIPVDVELEKKAPPDILWHGTGEKYVASIDRQGLIRKSRLYVHLSSDYDTAIKVGSRHGKPYVYQVDAKKMSDDGFDFFISVNGVWLTKTVPVEYLEIVSPICNLKSCFSL